MKELEKASSSTQLPIATQILQILDPIQPLANHLSELLRRPSAYYPLRYQDNVSVRLPHVVQMLGLTQMFMIQAQANLVHGNATAAFDDVMLILGLQHTTKDQPLLIVHLVRGWIALPRILVNLDIPALKGSAQKLVEQQTQVNQTVVACSLE